MKKFFFITMVLFISFLMIGTQSIEAQAKSTRHAEASKFGFIFGYGVDAKNVLNTFTGEFTYDMVEGPNITTKLSLTKEELQRIQQKMVEIDFFSYPDTFQIKVPMDNRVEVIPYGSYYYEVHSGAKVKKLWWAAYIRNKNDQADKLRELANLIRECIESKDAYKALPEPRSAYW